ncbi:hypothetical protein BBP40_005727 [Aspergillus hancockii]|nr:hypothetical protein BBP40_005727 [Aspergillus hancockii]
MRAEADGAIFKPTGEDVFEDDEEYDLRVFNRYEWAEELTASPAQSHHHHRARFAALSEAFHNEKIDASFSIVDYLPPKPESLRIYGYKKGRGCT